MFWFSIVVGSMRIIFAGVMAMKKFFFSSEAMKGRWKWSRWVTAIGNSNICPYYAKSFIYSSNEKMFYPEIQNYTSGLKKIITVKDTKSGSQNNVTGLLLQLRIYETSLRHSKAVFRWKSLALKVRTRLIVDYW